MGNQTRQASMPLSPLNFDGALGRQIVELHMWVVREGLRGADAAAIFDGLCQRFVSVGVPLWRAFVGMPTLHPQWGGYSYTWWRHLNAIEPAQFGRGHEYELILLQSPFGQLIRQVESPDRRKILGGTNVGVSAEPRHRSIIPSSMISPPPALPIISRKSSASVPAATLPTAPASAIRLRPIYPAASAMMTSYCCAPSCPRCPLR